MPQRKKKGKARRKERDGEKRRREEYFAIRTDESRHVLHNAKDMYPSLSTKIKFLANIQESNFLWRSNDDRTIDSRIRPPRRLTCLSQKGRNTKMFITCPRRRINDQKIQLVPIHIFNKLFYHAIFLGTSPDDRSIWRG